MCSIHVMPVASEYGVDLISSARVEHRKCKHAQAPKQAASKAESAGSWLKTTRYNELNVAR